MNKYIKYLIFFILGFILSSLIPSIERFTNITNIPFTNIPQANNWLEQNKTPNPAIGLTTDRGFKIFDLTAQGGHTEISLAVENYLSEDEEKQDKMKYIYGVISEWDVRNIENMSGLFKDKTKFTGQDDMDISQWDVSNVKVMSYMFSGATSFKGDISGWTINTNTNDEVDMSSMFSGATSFNVDISQWDVSRVTNMSNMFSGATSFNGDISSWTINTNTNDEVDMYKMFSGATSFNVDIGEWDVRRVTNMSYMFEKATSFNVDISQWDVSNVEDMSNMFYGATSFNNNNKPLTWTINTNDEVNMFRMFSGATSFNADISNWDVSRVINMSQMFFGATSFNADISQWDVSNVEDMSYMFGKATSFNGDISRWTIKINDDSKYNNMFYGARSFRKKGFCIDSNICESDAGNQIDIDMCSGVSQMCDFCKYSCNEEIIRERDIEIENEIPENIIGPYLTW